MKFLTRLMTIVASLVTFPAFGQIGSVSYYPNNGDLYYDGLFYLDSYIRWSGLGGWSVSDPKYEHDLWIKEDDFFLTTCTTATSLPDGYDDCPTAGVSEESPGKVFSFGSWHAKKIIANKTYVGAWKFTVHNAGNLSTPFELHGQENRSLCADLNIWCMDSTQTKHLITGLYMNWHGVPTIVTYQVL